MNLVPLFEEAIEFQNYNGSVLSNGKVAVFYIGRTRLADIFNDIEGLSPAENPKVLDNLGMGPLYVNLAFDYEIIVYDAYDNEMFSVKKYLHSKGEHSTANVVVTPSENIAVSAWRIGDVQVYMPYLTGDVGKTYEGIDPIVVNNEYNRISANHIPLGVQDPLYFVEDSETACIIGCSAQTEIPSALSSKWNEASDAVIANSAQWAEGTEYKAGSYVDITDNTISVTGLQPEGDYAYNSALSSKLDVTALPQDLVHSGDLTAYQPAGNYQTAGNYLSATDSAKFYPNDNPSGFITGVDLTGYATTAQLDEKLDKSDSGKFYPMTGNPSGFLTAHQSLQGYATEQWVEGKGYLTSVDIPESANWNEATTVVNNNSAIWNTTTNIVSANSAQWTEGSTANPQIPVTGINGIKISESGDQVVFEVSGDYATHNDVESATSGLLPQSAVNGIFNSVFANTVMYSNKPTANEIYASNNDLVNVGKIIGQDGSNFYIVPSGVLQIPNIITAAPDGLTANGLFTHTSYGFSANGITAAYYNSGFSAMGISAGKRGPLCIEGQAETIFATGGSGFTFSSQNTAFGTAQLTTAYGNQLVQMTAPKFEARNISGAGFSIEASGAKGYDASGNVVWDTNNPQVKNIICYNNTLTATGGLTGSIILTVRPSTDASNLTSSPYVIMDASQASYFGAYGPSAQTPTVSLKPDFITFAYQADNTKTKVGYNDIKQESGGSSWTLTASIQKRELEYNAETSAITAIAGSAIGGDCGGSALPISAGPGIKFEMIDNTLVASTQGPILDKITIAGTWNGHEVKQMLQSGIFETNVNSDVIPVNSAYSAASSKWIDPSNSYIQYGSTSNILPSTWVLGATGRIGSLSLLNGNVRVRSNDTTNTRCTAFVTIKWCEN